jgi:hypothetical protein
MDKLEQVVDVAVRMTGMTAADIETLAGVRDTTTQWAEQVATAFYDHLYSHEDSAALLAEQDRAKREQDLQNWYMHVIGCEHRTTFWKETWIVGLIHVMVNVENAYMLGMATRVSQLFRAKCLSELEGEQAAQVADAFQRVMSVISIVVAEGYVHGLLEGMAAVGLNASLMKRMRGVEIKRSIGKLQAEVDAANA